MHGGQRVSGLPAAVQGARLLGTKGRRETAKALDGRSDGFHPDGVKTPNGNAPAVSRYAWHLMISPERDRLGERP